MSEKQKIAGVICGIALIASMGFGWQFFLRANACSHYSNKIKQLMNDQDNLLFTFGFFAEHTLTEDRQNDFKKLIEVKEPLIKGTVEHFAKTCYSAVRKSDLITFLKGYEIYLITKQTFFKESQRSSFEWIRETFPYEPMNLDID